MQHRVVTKKGDIIDKSGSMSGGGKKKKGLLLINDHNSLIQYQ